MNKKTVIIITSIVVLLLFVVILFIAALRECEGVGGYKDGMYISRADCEISSPTDFFEIIIGSL